jgi:RNA-directed DNA polymerase
MKKANKSHVTLNSENDILAWNSIDWKSINLYISKLQQYIYKASSNGDIKRVRSLQHALIHSKAAKLLAVRRVTQDNLGKRTAGVDGIKNITPSARLALANGLKLTGKSQPARRVWIPKPGTEEKRPLGIPTLHDRALQALVKLALEPEWEARFEPNSYGFRPGRSTHDAIKQIKISLDKKAKYVLDADIAKCFDTIDHNALLEKLGLQGQLRRQIAAWLQAGVLNGDIFEKTERGTPQGGVISPLLANVALHGMETFLKEHMRQYSSMRWKGGYPMKSSERIRSLSIIRYADDFVIMHENKAVLLEIRALLETWLSTMGLELKESKTRLTHTLDPELSEDRTAGFDFLGYHIQHRESTRRSYKNLGKSLGYRTVIIPSKNSCKKYQTKLDTLIRTTNSQINLIQELNPIIRGWSRYFSVSSAHEGYNILKKQDYLLYIKLRRWAYRLTHSHKVGLFKFWRKIGMRKWVFSTLSSCESRETGLILAQAIDVSVSIDNYVKVRGNASPYDGNYVYWTRRMKRFGILPTRKAKLLRSQDGKCSFCGEYFKNGDVLHEHHIIPLNSGGSNSLINLQLVHSYCHHRIHRVYDMDSMPFVSLYYSELDSTQNSSELDSNLKPLDKKSKSFSFQEEDE